MLDDLKRFLDQNPDEVVIIFIGDYVSAADTQRVFQEAGLFDRLYPYDPTQPPPTLGQMIDAGQNLFVLSEFTGQPAGLEQPRLRPLPGHPVHLPAARPSCSSRGPPATQAAAPPTTPGLVNDTVVDPDAALPTGTTLPFGADWTGTPSCAPNRGTPDSPLFQINHWVTPGRVGLDRRPGQAGQRLRRADATGPGRA